MRNSDQPRLRGGALRKARFGGLQRNNPGDGDLDPPRVAPAAGAGYLRQVGKQVWLWVRVDGSPGRRFLRKRKGFEDRRDWTRVHSAVKHRTQNVCPCGAETTATVCVATYALPLSSLGHAADPPNTHTLGCAGPQGEEAESDARFSPSLVGRRGDPVMARTATRVSNGAPRHRRRRSLAV